MVVSGGGGGNVTDGLTKGKSYPCGTCGQKVKGNTGLCVQCGK